MLSRFEMENSLLHPSLVLKWVVAWLGSDWFGFLDLPLFFLSFPTFGGYNVRDAAGTPLSARRQPGHPAAQHRQPLSVPAAPQRL